jgi:hypothetical protein
MDMQRCFKTVFCFLLLLLLLLLLSTRILKRELIERQT